MTIDILTLFPEAVSGLLSGSIIGQAQRDKRLIIACHQIRDFTKDRQKQVDDYPYGGGLGMLMQADPLYNAWEHVCELRGGRPHTVLMSARGKVYTQNDAKRLSLWENLVLVCGHYEGVDQRFAEECVDEEISLGDFVMTGGEIAAAAIADSAARLLPGVLADAECFIDESHWSGLLEYPHYTRPEVWRGRAVPQILLSGHRENIRKWRRAMSLLETKKRRPDLFSKLSLSDEDAELLKSLEDSGQ